MRRISIADLIESTPDPNSEFGQKHALAEQLLISIKNNHDEIKRLFEAFEQEEAELGYRFYHQSYKVFFATELLKRAKKLFEKLALETSSLNGWFLKIIDNAITKEFDHGKTNQIWLEETRPLLEAFWHSKYFLKQMIDAAEMEKAPQMLPYDWAAVLYLYNLR